MGLINCVRVSTSFGSYTDDTAKASTSYTYRIKAINDHGLSKRSRWFHIDTPTAPQTTLVEHDDQNDQNNQNGNDPAGAPGHATPPGPSNKANISEGDTDLPATTATTGEVDVGGTVTGTIGTTPSNDTDWYRVEMEAGTRYQIDLEGVPSGRGTVPDPIINAVRDAAGNTITGTANDDSGVGVNARTTYTPTASGAHYIDTGSLATSDTGSYTLSVIVLGANGASEADLDFPNTSSTDGRVEVGGSVTGRAESTGSDGFRIVLEAGQRYRFDVEGTPNIRGIVPDPLLTLYDDSTSAFTASSFIASDDDSGEGTNSRMTFTATYRAHRGQEGGPRRPRMGRSGAAAQGVNASERRG